ncbi:hypothetical protein ASD11_07915 [Aeromicrobium sp. Root495]|uniref:hypothetical protein n=1 Tax=Aeromicrobium sp. Root495 TaxID=1736550 RepID=UPI0006F604CF|nr:hypothetical protein [Aeromicrobium sp. Root495]KQY59478.1 hypothetical protein ASD11_07915 [Aeromicrobium sp. Root495]
MLRVVWSVGDLAGEASVAPSHRFVVARRMTLPQQQPVLVDEVGGSTYVFLRLPYVSDPALVVTATEGHPVLHRGQRANGAVMEISWPSGESTTPAPEQRVSITSPGAVVSLRFPDLTVTARLEFAAAAAVTSGTGTMQLGVASLEHDDAWLVAAIAVALSPEPGLVGHADLKRAFALWRGAEELSVGTFDRNVLRPALESREIELPGPRLNKILYLVERCRRTHEFPEHVLADIRERLDELGA